MIYLTVKEAIDMCSQNDLRAIITRLHNALIALFPEQCIDIILFGSYARSEADEQSDIDLLFLVDAPRELIAMKNWQIGEAAASLLMDYGVVVSPVVENRDYYRANVRTLPFFRSIEREGVRISA